MNHLNVEKKCIEINDDSKGTYNTNSQINHVYMVTVMRTYLLEEL